MSLARITALVQEEHSKKQALKIIKFVGKDQQRFNDLLKICMGKDERLAQCASWPLSYCVEEHPEFVKGKLSKIISHLSKPVHHAVRRNFVRLLRFVEIPAMLETKVLEACFRIIHNTDELLANKVFAIYAILPICAKYPELFGELKASMDSQMPYQTAGFKAAARKVEREYRKSIRLR
ncbi:MAG: hypothetical protein IPP51_06645 [Bacteroidetes bacterium]|nr:hypothetical protein [Bacteroidota bacterium]